MTQRNHWFFPWDEQADPSELLTGKAGQFLKDYANISPERMEEHVKQIAKKGWDAQSYPCFHKFLFLDFDLSRSAVYETVIELVKAGNVFLDLGCGLGQDIRRLVHDCVPAENLIGLEMLPEFIDLGYELFQDRSTFEARFLVQDFFQNTPELEQFTKRIKVINPGYFMHLFNWDTQLRVAKRMIQLLAPEKGALIMGVNVGSQSPVIWDNLPGGLCDIFVHNQDTLSDLWKQAGEETHVAFDLQITTEDFQYFKDVDSEGFRLRWTLVRQ